MAKKISVSENTLNFHNKNGDELAIDKNGIAIFDCKRDKPSRFLKVYINGRFSFKWEPDMQDAYNIARQWQFDDLEADAASVLGV